MKSYEELRRETLLDMIRRRDLLNGAIADLQYSLDHPLPPIQIDFKAIEEEAKGNMAFLEKCKKEREGKT